MIKKNILLSIAIAANLCAPLFAAQQIPMLDLGLSDIDGGAASSYFALASASRGFSSMINLVPTAESTAENTAAAVKARHRAEREAVLEVTSESVTQEIRHELKLAEETLGQNIEADTARVFC